MAFNDIVYIKIRACLDLLLSIARYIQLETEANKLTVPEKIKLNELEEVDLVALSFFKPSNRKIAEKPQKEESLSQSNNPTDTDKGPINCGPQKFEHLFKNPDHEIINGCIEVLRKVEPQLLDDNNNFLQKPRASKGAICVWIDQMNKRGLTYHFTDRNIYSNILKEKFPGMEIHESMFGKPHPGAEKKYKNDFIALLSLVAQKGKERK